MDTRPIPVEKDAVKTEVLRFLEERREKEFRDGFHHTAEVLQVLIEKIKKL